METKPYVSSLYTSTQPITAQIAAFNPKRNVAIIANLGIVARFYIKLAPAATPASATNFDFFLDANQQVTLDDWQGVITCFPVPNAGELNISEGGVYVS